METLEQWALLWNAGTYHVRTLEQEQYVARDRWGVCRMLESAA